MSGYLVHSRKMRFLESGFFVAVLFFVLLQSAFVGAEAKEDTAVPEAVRERMKAYSAVGVEVLAYVRGPGNLIGVVCRVPEKLLTLPWFKGQASGIQGDQVVVFFLSPDGRFMVIGAVLDLEKGKEYVSEVVAKYASQGAVTQPLERAQPEDLESLVVVSEGKDDTEDALYCFVDVRCPHSRDQFEKLHGKELSVKWVMITHGDPISITRTGFFLGSSSPNADGLAELFGRQSSAPLREAFMNFSADEKKQLAKGILALEKNMNFASKYGIRSTPVCMRVKSGKVESVYRGVFDYEFIVSGKR